MTKYPHNSPQALARLLVMQILCGNIEAEDTFEKKLNELEMSNIYKIIGLGRKAFIQVLKDYCDDISNEEDEDGTIRLIDQSRINRMLDAIDSPKMQRLAITLGLGLARMSGKLAQAEWALLQYILEYWHLKLPPTLFQKGKKTQDASAQA